MQTVTIVGVGRVGSAFALALAESGFEIDALVSRDPSAAGEVLTHLDSEPRVVMPEELKQIGSEGLLITTQDSEIENAADTLARVGFSKPNRYAFHASGAMSSKSLAPLTKIGWKTASLHPLVSISDARRGSAALRAAYFAVEGEPEAVKAGQLLVSRLGGSHFAVPTASKFLYHAAAVTACGHLAALLAVSYRMLEECGIEPAVSRKILVPLISSTLENIAQAGPAAALTGPFARADVETIRGHLRMLSGIGDPGIEDVYRVLGGVSVDLARRQGADEQRLDEILEIILLDKNTSE